MKLSRYTQMFFPVIGIILIGLSCQKSATFPLNSGVAAFTVVNAIPNSQPIITVINTSSPIIWFNFSIYLNPYGSYHEYSPPSGNDTIYAVQGNSDTLNVGPKVNGEMFYNILPLKKGEIYSLFLCGADTSSPDYLFTTDTLPYHGPSDSTVGIRFVNLSAGSNSISINLEGNPNGSEVDHLPYKSVTGFKNYLSNSTVSGYSFVVRDVTTGDSLTQFNLNGTGNIAPGYINGYGLFDPSNNGNLLTFKNVTIAIYGSENVTSNSPLSTMLIDDY